MNKAQIEKYLKAFRSASLDTRVLDWLNQIKQGEVGAGDQTAAKETWCLEQTYKVIRHFMTGYKCLQEGRQFDAWNEFDRADIEFSFLRQHLDYSGYISLVFIEEYIPRFQKLFPYRHFLSRESIVKSESCSVCGRKVTLRNSCGHQVGEIYNGEQCFRNIDEFEFKGESIVTNPFDKYTVLFPEGLEYNYHVLDSLIKHLDSPFEKWELHILKELKSEYQGVGRNQPCPCGTGKKYKKCCRVTGEAHYDHYKITFLEKGDEVAEPRVTINTWKNNTN